MAFGSVYLVTDWGSVCESGDWGSIYKTIANCNATPVNLIAENGDNLIDEIGNNLISD